MLLIHKLYKTPAVIAGVLFFQILWFAGYAQNLVQSDLEHRFNLYNINGTPVVNPYPDVNGTPYFLPSWKSGALKTFDGQIFNNLSLKLDLKSQEVHFRRDDNAEMFIKAGSVRQVILIDSSTKPAQTIIFQSGYPPVDNQKEINFYLVLCEGKISFLKSLRKNIIVEKDDFSGETRKEFRLSEDLYFWDGKSIERIKKDKNYMLNYMNAQRGKIEEFLAQHKLSFKSADDIKSLVEFYNAL